jgi:hypothetical protein
LLVSVESVQEVAREVVKQESVQVLVAAALPGACPGGRSRRRRRSRAIWSCLATAAAVSPFPSTPIGACDDRTDTLGECYASAHYAMHYPPRYRCDCASVCAFRLRDRITSTALSTHFIGESTTEERFDVQQDQGSHQSRLCRAFRVIHGSTCTNAFIRSRRLAPCSPTHWYRNCRWRIFLANYR